MSERVEFFVVGEPRPAGSKTTGVAHRRDPATGQQVPVTKPDGRLQTFTKDSSGAKGKTWRADVREAATEAMGGAPMLDGPLLVSVEFRMPRLKGHYGSGANAQTLKASAPYWHTVRPDADKLSRALLDALTSVVWKDDAQVAHKSVTKRYTWPGERVGAHVVVAPLPPNGAAQPQQQLEVGA